MHSPTTSYQARPCPERLTSAHLADYRESGFIAFENVLTAAEVAAARAALSACTQQLLAAARQGRAVVSFPPADARGNRRGTRVSDAESGMALQFEPDVDPLAVPPEIAEQKFRKLAGYQHQHPVFEALVEHPRIQGFATQILGEAAILKAVMALSKPARIGSAKPWHQDCAYFNWLPLDLITTVWIALDDATEANGCMHMLPGGHQRGALKHWHDFDCEIVPDRLDQNEGLPVPLAAGGVLYFSGMVPHQTPPNRSDSWRRALQFQYRGVTTRQASKEDYAKVFAEADGTPATCAMAEVR